jgi:ankyrin repeat protein
MSICGVYFRKIVTIVFAICINNTLVAQVSSKDTADYLPEYYDNALEYNLMIAASRGLDSEIVRLIHRGAEIEAQTQDGATSLIIAVANLRQGAVNTLLSYNADPNKATNSSETPLIIVLRKLVDLESGEQNIITTAHEQGCLEIAESLIRYGADIDYQDNHGVTALNYASAYGSFSFVDLLIYYRADIDKRDHYGTTPLMSAIWAGYANVADLLIQNGANLEARDDDGFTPFLIAAQNGDTLMLHYLIKEGVNIYVKCGKGWDALNLCIKYNHRDAIEMLVKSGEKWSDSTNKALNHYDVAARYGRDDVYSLLEKSKLPDKYKPRINHLEVSLSAKFNPQDIYTGMSFIFREPRKNFGIQAGFDTKLWYTRVMVKMSEDLYYQYFDKSSDAYIGIFKDFHLTDHPMRSNFIFTGSLSGGYRFGNNFRGTNISPEKKFMVIPSALIKWNKRNFSIYAGLEYMNTDFYNVWPVWGRVGISYNFDFEFGKTPVKQIKWY